MTGYHEAFDTAAGDEGPSQAAFPDLNGGGRPGGPRSAGWVRSGSIIVIVASLMVIAWSLPTARAVQWLQSRVDELGSAGPVAFGAAYVIAALLFIPGSALTIAAGAIFGLAWGVLTVWFASTLAAAAAFLIGRHVARGSVERLARRYPRFSAIDQAFGEGGWKMVALLRLSPVVPYSAINYLFGLTAVRFWPYLLASWLAMLPGTFLYVYLGHAGVRGVAAASGTPGRTAGEWAFLAAGLAATVAVTVYLTILARRRIRERLDDRSQSAGMEPAQAPHDAAAAIVRARSRRWSLIAMPMAAFLFASAAVAAVLNRGALQSLFGPPQVQMKEAYERKPGGPSFDHSALDAVLEKHVSEGGWVDYQALKSDPAELDAYIASLGKAPFDELGRDEKLALLINAYNAFTLRLILDHYPLPSIKDIPEKKRWEDARWRIGGHTWSLNQIEHEQIRSEFREPRIHFALVCAAVGCPPLRNEAYVGDRIDEQLEEQTRYVHSHERWFRFDGGEVVRLTPLYKWYGGDFKQVAGSALKFAARYSEGLKNALEASREPRIEWLDYDWRLNSRENAP